MLTSEAKLVVGDYGSYLDLWQAGFGDRFFDMGTMTRLGTALENGLRDFHLSYGGASAKGFYQRIVSDKGEQELYVKFLSDCGYNLRSNPSWLRMRELMTHRHLYAHRSGLVDEDYVDALHRLTGHDIEPDLAELGYPNNDVY